MNSFRFILKSLRHYRRSNLTLFSGVFISIMVLTGALITGDSVRYSLERIASARLGGIRHAMKTGISFNDSLSQKISLYGKTKTAAVLQSDGIVISNTRKTRINRVSVYGIDDDFGQFWNDEKSPQKNEVYISINTAKRLNVKQGDDLLLKIVKAAKGPPNAPFTGESSVSASVTVKIAGISQPGGEGNFSLEANQSAPFNIFMNKAQLQKIQGLADRSNLLLTGELSNPDSVLKKCWIPSDAGIRFRDMSLTGPNSIFIPEKISGLIMNHIHDAEGYLAWLVNDISIAGKSTPYSFVVATNHLFGKSRLTGKEMIINSWLAEDLSIKKGDQVKISYFTVDRGRELQEKSSSFIVKDIIPVNDPVWDRTLMPEFPGISDALSCRDWDNSTPIDLKKIRKKDEDYWKVYKGTPKAFISAEAGLTIWKNPYGTLTTIRFSSEKNDPEKIKKIISSEINPAELGMIFDPVYATGESAAQNSTDFGGLFLGLGSLIILAGILLTAMIYSMQITERLQHVKTMSALGFTTKNLFLILFSEALLILFLAGIAGAIAGVLYTRLIINGLGSIWIPATGTSDLVLNVKWASLVSGAIAGVLIPAVILFLILRKKLSGKSNQKKILKSKTGTISFNSLWHIVKRNLFWNKKRNAGILILTATGVLIIVLTGVNRRESGSAFEKTSGTGGFTTYAGTTIPLPATLTTNPSFYGIDPAEDVVFKNMKVYPLAHVERNDASCLNLNRVVNPDLTGVPAGLFDGRFSFENKLFDELSWTSLDKELFPGIIPGIIDQTVLQWSIAKKTGDTLFYNDEKGNRLGIRIIATIKNSIFQGSILVSDSLLRKYFPSSARHTIIVAEGDPEKAGDAAEKLNEVFSSYGMMAIPASERLASFDAVQNTYLSVFLLLGGFGILIATIGLGVFITGDLSSRKREFALYAALGFTWRSVFLTGTGSYFILFISGITGGIIISAISILMLPEIIDISFSRMVFWLISAVLLNGILWIAVPMLIILRKIKPGLLREE